MSVNGINGIDVETLREAIDQIGRDPALGLARLGVTTQWGGNGPGSATRTKPIILGGREIRRDFTIEADEPEEFFGSGAAPNPQELLMAALNACMLAGYVTAASVRGIDLEAVRIETDGALDLRGFLGIDPSVSPGLETLRCRVTLRGSGTSEQFRQVHETVLRTSPNYWTLSNPVRIEPELVIEQTGRVETGPARAAEERRARQARRPEAGR